MALPVAKKNGSVCLHSKYPDWAVDFIVHRCKKEVTKVIFIKWQKKVLFSFTLQEEICRFVPLHV